MIRGPRPFPGSLPRPLRRLLRPLTTPPTGMGAEMPARLREAAERLSQTLTGTLMEGLGRDAPRAESDGFVALEGFDNPGGLRARVRPAARPRAPLLVLLHGCTQDATRFAAASGFVDLAEETGAALLLPEQSEANNPQRCFNWFTPEAGGREVASLRRMLAACVARFGSDAGEVFVAGLSAGGAMAAALMASAPDLVAAGAVVAGLPVGAAQDMAQGFAAMQQAPPRDRRGWLAALPPAMRGAGWPRLAVWHGTADRTVDPSNGEALVAQWTARLDVPATPTEETQPTPRLTRRVWRVEGVAAVEQWRVTGLGHAWPVGAGMPADPYVVAAGIDATDAIARFWGLRGGA